MLDKFFHKKKEEKEYISALLVSDNRIDAAMWEVGRAGEVKILKTSQVEYSGAWEEAIKAADKAITIVEENLPEGKELAKVVFGLFPNWVFEDHIKESDLHKLKQLTKELALTPVGFVELPIAISHELHKAEGVQSTVILVGIEEKQLTVSLFKIGKLVHTKMIDRTESVALDIEGALSSFVDIEVLPSRILLYGTVSDIEQIKATLLNHPWTKKAGFLHFPKIEVLPSDYPVKAVAVASSAEIIPHTDEVETTAMASVDETIDVTTVPETSETANVTAVHAESVAKIAEDLFPTTQPTEETAHKKMDLAIEQEINDIKEHPETAVSEEVMASHARNVEEVPLPKQEETDKDPHSKFHFKIPKVSFVWPAFSFRVPQFKNSHTKIIAGGVGVVLVLLILGGWYVGNWILPKATVKILVNGQVFDKTENITLDTSTDSVDVENNILPAKTVKVDVTAEEKTSATGKKTVGDNASGEVTIYNKTQNEKIFKKGTVLISSSLKFTLNDEVKIASASENVGSLTYGTSKVKVTAAQIGTSSNLPVNTDFNFDSLPNTSYSARNEAALSGGTSREIAVVSRDDREVLREKILEKLITQAETEVKSKLDSKEKLLQNSIITEVSSESLSKEIGEEADEVTLSMVVSATGFVYNEEDFWLLLDKVASENVSSQYEYSKDNAKLSIEEITTEDKDTPVVKARFTLELIPKVDIGGLADQMAGKKSQDVVSMLKERTGISGVDLQINWPFKKNPQNLPKNPNKISVEVAKL